MSLKLKNALEVLRNKRDINREVFSVNWALCYLIMHYMNKLLLHSMSCLCFLHSVLLAKCHTRLCWWSLCDYGGLMTWSTTPCFLVKQPLVMLEMCNDSNYWWSHRSQRFLKIYYLPRKNTTLGVKNGLSSPRKTQLIHKVRVYWFSYLIWPWPNFHQN